MPDDLQRLADEQNVDPNNNPHGTARDDVLRYLREAKPSFLRDGFGLRGPHSPNIKRQTDFSQGAVNRQQIQNQFPPDDATETTQGASAESVPKITFICIDVSTSEDDVTTYKVHVADGEINGVLPVGMGNEDFVLTLADPTDAFVYAYVTFNPETLAITSRTVAASSVDDVPESRVDEGGGFLVYILAEAFKDDNDQFQVINRRLGDINFELVYGSMNGFPALLPVNSDPGWLDLPLD